MTLPDSSHSLGGKVMIPEEAQAIREVKAEREGLVCWTNGSRKKDEWVRCAVVWKEDRWEMRRVHLG